MELTSSNNVNISFPNGGTGVLGSNKHVCRLDCMDCIWWMGYGTTCSYPYVLSTTLLGMMCALSYYNSQSRCYRRGASMGYTMIVCVRELKVIGPPQFFFF